MRNQITTTTRAASTDALGLLRAAFTEGRKAHSVEARTAAGMSEPHAFLRKKPIAGVTLTTQALMPRGVGLGRDGRLSLANLLGESAGQQISIADAVALASRVLRAGAHLIDEAGAVPLNTGNPDAPALQRVPTGLRIVKPAKFSAMDDSAGDPEVTASTLASIISESKIERPDDLTRYSFAVPLKRGDLRDIEDDRLLAEVLAAIVLGIGGAADACLLAAIHAASPANFHLGAAAAKGLRFHDLKAIIGADGYSQGTGLPAQVTIDQGALYLAGIPADMTDAAEPSTIAAFDRFGVCLGGEITVLVERKSAAGDVALTCHVGMAAVVPDAGFAWKVE